MNKLAGIIVRRHARTHVPSPVCTVGSGRCPSPNSEPVRGFGVMETDRVDEFADTFCVDIARASHRDDLLAVTIKRS